MLKIASVSTVNIGTKTANVTNNSNKYIHVCILIGIYKVQGYINAVVCLPLLGVYKKLNKFNIYFFRPSCE